LGQELGLFPAQKERLKKISEATLERLLAKIKPRHKPKGKSLTKPGNLLKSQIAVRMHKDWSKDQIGFFEADLVHHCGESVEGEYVHTLTLVEVSSGWVEMFTLEHRGQQAVVEGIDLIRRQNARHRFRQRSRVRQSPSAQILPETWLQSLHKK
jgi:hypothetical protein